jgi:TnpA family transposase
MQFSPRLRDLGDRQLSMLTTDFVLRYLEDGALRHRMRAQLNKGEKLHDLRKFLFFAREGVVSQQYEEEQGNQAACLNLLTYAPLR